MEEEQEQKPPADTKAYNDDFKQQLAAYRRAKEQDSSQQQTVESNLTSLFSNFKVFTQQRHKIQLEEINEFQPEESISEVEKSKNSLAAQIFSQLNPFSQFVIEEIVQDQTQEAEEEEEKQSERLWYLHEDLFKLNSQSVVNPDHLKKTSSQMFAVYKYYGDPTLKVKCNHYTGSEDFVDVKDLVPGHKFFDAPEKGPEVQEAM